MWHSCNTTLELQYAAGSRSHRSVIPSFPWLLPEHGLFASRLRRTVCNFLVLNRNHLWLCSQSKAVTLMFFMRYLCPTARTSPAVGRFFQARQPEGLAPGHGVYSVVRAELSCQAARARNVTMPIRSAGRQLG